MVNKIWCVFIVVGIIFSFISGNTLKINETIVGSSKDTLELFLQIFPIITLWLGIMNIALKSNVLDKLSKVIHFFIKPIFKNIPSNHDSIKYISTNIIANVLGLGSAATPAGLKAMKSLQELNPNKDVASKEMLTFTALNTSAVTIFPTTLISLRILYKSVNPNATVIITIISTIVATIVCLITNNILTRRL